MEFLINNRMPSGWVIDVWNCHGVLKPQRFAGYGNMSDEILKEAEKIQKEKYVWFDCGYYTVPLRESIKNDIEKAGLLDELTERLEKVLSWILYDRNDGAINFSGFYMVSIDELKAVEKTIQRVRKKAKKENAQYELLKYLEVME